MNKNNKALLIEIFDNKEQIIKSKDKIIKTNEISLADMFKAKKKDILNKLD